MLVYLQTIESREDRRLFEQLYDKYKRLMLSAARQVLGNWADAEDAVHQAFVYIAGDMGRIKKIESGKRKAFLLLITEHKALDILRQNSRTVPLGDPDNFPGLPLKVPEEDSPAAALAALNARYREVILLRYDYGYSTREIAKMFGLRTESMQRLLTRAKKALAKKLAEMEGEENV